MLSCSFILYKYHSSVYITIHASHFAFRTSHSALPNKQTTMCRYYDFDNRCGHLFRRVIRCRKCPSGDYTEEQIPTSRQMECPACFEDWASYPGGQRENAPSKIPASQRAYVARLWARIHSVIALYEHNKIDGTGPFCIDKIKVKDREWLEQQLDLLGASILDPSQKRRTLKDRMIVLDIINLIQYSKIREAHGKYLAEQASKPKLLTQVKIANLDDNHKTCPICYCDFTAKMKPVHFPCHQTHVVCESSAIHIIRTGGNCPFCRSSFDMANYQRFEEHFDWLKDEDIVTPFWMAKLREDFD